MKLPMLRSNFKLRKLVKTLGLRMLMFFRPVLPRPVLAKSFFRVAGIELGVAEEDQRADVLVCKFKRGARGALCVSIDYDLPVSRPLRSDWRRATAKILELAATHSVPTSWGICGMLALRETETFERLKNTSAAIDLGAHTFNHVDFSSPACTDDVAESEIMRCVELLNDVKRPVTFIFPWNRLGHFRQLRECGFVAYRGNGVPKLAYPTKKRGMWSIPGSYYLVEKSAGEIGVIFALIDSAISYGGVLHLWSHPWDLTIEGSVDRFMQQVLDPLFEHAAEKSKQQLLWTCTMRELANYCEARESCQIKNLSKAGDRLFFSVSCEVLDRRFDSPLSVTLKIRVPRRWREGEIRVFVDELEHMFDNDCVLSKHAGQTHLFLTLSFRKVTHEISLLKDAGKSTPTLPRN